MGFYDPISVCSKHGCMKPCSRAVAKFGAAAATASFSSMSMDKWNKRRCVNLAGGN